MPTHCPGGSICHSAEKLILGLSDVKKYRMDDIVQDLLNFSVYACLKCREVGGLTHTLHKPEKKPSPLMISSLSLANLVSLPPRQACR